MAVVYYIYRVEAMKRDRITMVAHLVARVREVFAAAEG